MMSQVHHQKDPLPSTDIIRSFRAFRAPRHRVLIPVGSGEGIKPQTVMQNGKSSGRVKTSAWDGSKATQALRKRSNTMLLA